MSPIEQINSVAKIKRALIAEINTQDFSSVMKQLWEALYAAKFLSIKVSLPKRLRTLKIAVAEMKKKKPPVTSKLLFVATKYVTKREESEPNALTTILGSKVLIKTIKLTLIYTSDDVIAITNRVRWNILCNYCVRIYFYVVSNFDLAE